MALTLKQQAFVAQYLVDLNATQAAIRAGYSAKTAAEIGYQNLGKPEIAEAVSAAMTARAERTFITADRAVEELARLALSDITQAVAWGDAVPVMQEGGDFIPVQGIALVASDKLSPAVRASIAEVRQTKDGLAIKLHSKTAALDMLGKHLGLYAPEKHEHTGKNGGPIEMRTYTNAERARRVAALVAKVQADSEAETERKP